MTFAGKKLWYFADPMCSWCYGFGPVLQTLRENHRDLEIHPVMGGLRPYTQQPIDDAARAEILRRWLLVRQWTGRDFCFENALPDGFIYDTEPACRAVVVMKVLSPGAALDYLQALQCGFYRDRRDITQPDILTELALPFVASADSFRSCFDDPATQRRTKHEFEITAIFPIRGFPALAGEARDGFTKLASGYVSYARLQRNMDAWINQTSQLNKDRH